MNKNTKNAFTLAEVLITLAIIGVVAALTIPTLVQSYKKQVASVKLKKFYSTMLQAIRLSEIDNGPALKWSRRDVPLDADGNYDFLANGQVCYDYFMKYLAPYLKYIKAEITPQNIDMNNIEVMSVYFADGSMITTHNGACLDIHYYINGDRGAKVYGKDLFNFAICPEGRHEIGGHAFGALRYMDPNMPATTREEARVLCQKKAETCGALLQFDNWEFKSDYPYKL